MQSHESPHKADMRKHHSAKMANVENGCGAYQDVQIGATGRVCSQNFACLKLGYTYALNRSVVVAVQFQGGSPVYLAVWMRDLLDMCDHLEGGRQSV